LEIIGPPLISLSYLFSLLPCAKVLLKYEEIVKSEDGWERISMLDYLYPQKAIFSEIKKGGINLISREIRL
jgi:hypothetical protein